MRRFVITLGASLLMAASGIGSAAIWIVDFSGELGDFILERGDQRIPLEIYRELQSGDRASVLAEGSVLSLKQDDGNWIEVRKNNSPYLIRDAGRPPGPMANLWHGFRAWLTRQRVEGIDRPVVSVSFRGGSHAHIHMPLVSGATARLQAGTRPLYLAWQGGQGPYQVRLTTSDRTKVLLDQSDISMPGGNTQPFQTAPLTLEPGQYRLMIGDAQEWLTLAIEVLPPAALPVPPAPLAAIAPSEVQQTLTALWLATQNGDDWRLEAYQRAMSLEGNHPSTRLLRYSLEQGHSLPSKGDD